MEARNLDFSYKDGIIATRTGCVGSSDAKMLMQVSALGTVPRSAYNRLFVVKGLSVHDESVSSMAVDYGNEIEMMIYSHLSAQDGRYQSNPYWESEMFSRKNVKCIAHPDIVLEDEATHTLSVFEVKTSHYTTAALKKLYRAQLFFQYRLACERVLHLGYMWRVRMYLVHYDTSGLDLSAHNDFDPGRLKVSGVRVPCGLFDLGRAMDIVDCFLENLTADDLKHLDVVEARHLPTSVRGQFSAVAGMLREIKRREAEVEEFKNRLYAFLLENDISKVRCDDFSFSLVRPSQVVTFDAKKFWEDWAEEHEQEAATVREKYKKITAKRGYVKITV